MNLEYLEPLPTVAQLQEQYPLSTALAAKKAENDRALAAVFNGTDSRLLLIIGPCSADREDAVVEYCARLRRLQEQVSDKLLLLPRLYTIKPRSTGDGYKGMLHQPDPKSSPDMAAGLAAMRRLHLTVLEQTGFSGADELLYPESAGYILDCISYGAVGARSVENQQHRFLASGLDIPVGMKNPTGGDMVVLLNSIQAAHHGHTFALNGYAVKSRGNPLAHGILRGYCNKHGRPVANYHYDDLRFMQQIYTASQIKNPALIVDTNHANSGKKFHEQPRIAKEVLASRKISPDIGKIVRGLMIESYLVDGCQPPTGTTAGQSITDPCLGWHKTKRLVLELAELL